MSKVSFLRTTESKIVFYNFRYLNLLSNIPAEMQLVAEYSESEGRAPLSPSYI